MPTTYAHLRFGQEVLRQLPADLQKEIKSFIRLYQTGQHGPDILFYYRPYHKNALTLYGSELHNERGRQVFRRFRQYLKLEKLEPTALKVYILGFLCHYALDKYCHPYVYQIQDETGLSHSEIEAEFDRMLLIKDGFDPLRHHISSHICTTDFEAGIIQKCFPQFKVSQMKEALITMRHFLDLLVAPGKMKRSLVKGMFLLSGNYPSLNKLVINRQANPTCQPINEELYRRYKMAIHNAVWMINDFNQQLKEENMVFSDDYFPTFERD